MKTPRLFPLSLLSTAALLVGLSLAMPSFANPVATDSAAVQAIAAQLSPHLEGQTLPAPIPTHIQATNMRVMVDQSVPVSFDQPAASVFIANPDIADIQVISPTSVMVFGKKEGQTTLKITDDMGNDLVYRTIFVAQNLDALRKALHVALPNDSIQVDAIPDGLVLSGTVSNPTSIEDARRLASRYISDKGDIINKLVPMANNQVQIQVRFAEVSRDVDKRFGINWENSFSIGEFALGLATGAEFIDAGSTTWTRTEMDGATNDSIAGSFNNSHMSVNAMIDALAKNDLVTILAEPSLTAMSGQTASFLAGGEFPVPVPQGDTVTIEWKEYGVSLAFTPTIVNGDRINLHVRPEVSQLSDSGSVDLGSYSIPALTTRRAETTIELNSGQTFALAGLLNNQQSQAVSKYPFLGDIPVLGPLFRSSRFQNNETELVIIITPYIVKPTSAKNISLPTDGFKRPSDKDFFFDMKETASDPRVESISGEPTAIRLERKTIAPPALEETPLPAIKPLPPKHRYQSLEEIKARPSDKAAVSKKKAAPQPPQKKETKTQAPAAQKPAIPASVPSNAMIPLNKAVPALPPSSENDEATTPTAAPSPVPVQILKTPAPASGTGGFILE